MLFKNLMWFCYADKWQPLLQAMEAALEKNRFVPCEPSQAQSVGWVEPRGIGSGPLVESVNGQYLLQLMVEEKMLPAEVVKRRLLEVCDKIEKDSGRRPGRQYQRELKEQIIQELLPYAFARRSGIRVWIEPGNRWILVEATSQSSAGLAITALVKTFEGLAVREMNTRKSATSVMTDWLIHEAPHPFSIEMDCELRSDAVMRPLVRHSRMPVDTDEIKSHIEQGMQPCRLALNWAGRVGFVLTHDLKVRGIHFFAIVFESGLDECDLFDVDATITTGELKPLLQDLLIALGGEVQHAV